jgi:hypothetical protein
LSSQLTQALGESRAWTVTARQNGIAIAGVFTGSDALSAQVFAGDGQPVLFAPTCSWVDAAAGTIRVAITAAQLAAAAITPGEYLLRVFVTPVSDGQPRLVGQWSIAFTPAPGTDAAPTAYATYRDLGDYSPELQKLQDKLNDLTQFAHERHTARAETDNRILNGYRPVPGRARRYYNAGRTGAGPYGPLYLTAADLADPAFAAPTATAVRAWLDAGGLRITPDIAEFNARWASALVYGGQAGTSNAYAQQAVVERGLAEAAWTRAKAALEIDTTSPLDGVYEVRIGQDVTWLT